jgi:UDP-N-acetylmuramyl pentapeptide phosphotransferase/UDP-N-acetylglucosamine-1-phosphate transferase
VGGSILFFAVAAIATLSATELVRVIALRLGALDSPGGRRMHRRPTVRLGGLGIFWGFAVAMLLAVYTESSARSALDASAVGAIGLLAGAGLMLITGLLDDIRGLGPAPKLSMQLAAALCVYFAGWRVEFIGLPGVGAWPVGVMSLPLTVGWIVFATNAVNLIDGLDGLASGIALVAALGVFALVGPGAGSGVIAIALAGALFGFLWFNMSPALIFMGDAGSLFVGFTVATLTLRGATRIGPEAFPFVPVLLLAVPLTDAASAILRRLSAAARGSDSPRQWFRHAHRWVLTADRGHLHHRLLDAGLSPRAAALMLHVTAVPFAFAAWLFAGEPLAAIAMAVAAAITWHWAWRRIEAHPVPIPDGDVIVLVPPLEGAERDVA